MKLGIIFSIISSLACLNLPANQGIGGASLGFDEALPQQDEFNANSRLELMDGGSQNATESFVKQIKSYLRGSSEGPLFKKEFEKLDITHTPVVTTQQSCAWLQGALAEVSSFFKALETLQAPEWLMKVFGYSKESEKVLTVPTNKLIEFRAGWAAHRKERCQSLWFSYRRENCEKDSARHTNAVSGAIGSCIARPFAPDFERLDNAKLPEQATCEWLRQTLKGGVFSGIAQAIKSAKSATKVGYEWLAGLVGRAPQSSAEPAENKSGLLQHRDWIGFLNDYWKDYRFLICQFSQAGHDEEACGHRTVEVAKAINDCQSQSPEEVEEQPVAVPPAAEPKPEKPPLPPKPKKSPPRLPPKPVPPELIMPHRAENLEDITKMAAGCSVAIETPLFTIVEKKETSKLNCEEVQGLHLEKITMEFCAGKDAGAKVKIFEADDSHDIDCGKARLRYRENLQKEYCPTKEFRKQGISFCEDAQRKHVEKIAVNFCAGKDDETKMTIFDADSVQDISCYDARLRHMEYLEEEFCRGKEAAKQRLTYPNPRDVLQEKRTCQDLQRNIKAWEGKLR